MIDFYYINKGFYYSLIPRNNQAIEAYNQGSNLIDTNTFRQIAQDYRASGQEQTAQDYENAAACIDCLRAELKSKNQFIAFNTGLKLGGAKV